MLIWCHRHATGYPSASIVLASKLRIKLESVQRSGACVSVGRPSWEEERFPVAMVQRESSERIPLPSSALNEDNSRAETRDGLPA
jgi:hypothetical protein